MTHITDRIQAYLDGELSPAATVAVAEHLRDCPACRREVADAQRCWRLVDSAAPASPRRSVWPQVAAQLARRRARPGWPWPQRGLALVAAVAGLAFGRRLGGPAARGETGAAVAADTGAGANYLEASLPSLDQLWLQLGEAEEDTGS